MDVPPEPYRSPAPRSAPDPERLPPRRLAVVANVIMALSLAVSFGTCSRYGGSRDHIEADLGNILAVVSFVVGAGCAGVAIGVCAQHVKAARAVSASAGGLALTVLLSVGATFFAPIFWMVASSGGIAFGGWGRPLRIGRRSVTPGVKPSTEWSAGPRPSVEALDPTARALLADLWLHDARKEHASVPAFGQVAWQLVALGAPADLVKRAHRSCLQEIDHAERCFALASTYAGTDLGVQEMPALHTGAGSLPRNRGRALRKVAVEALIDGALLEDYNAELAATALARVTDEAARQALVRVVEDERDHAALAWDIVAFCVAQGGEPVKRALRRAFAGVGATPVSLYEPSLVRRLASFADHAILAAHGRVASSMALPVYRARREAAARRLEALLAAPSRAAA